MRGTSPAQQFDPLVQTLISQVNVDSLMRTVKDLSGENTVTVNGVSQKIITRFIHTGGHAAARAYLKSRFESYGLTPVMQVVDTACTNILLVKQGTTYPNRKWIVGAHYDDNPEGTGTPGADDNATGVATVLEVARLLAAYDTKYTVVLALWDWEEVGMVGSVFYATAAYANHDSILGVINMDMIGFDGNNDGKMEIHSRDHTAQLTDTVVAVNRLYGLGLNPQVLIPGATNSDHGSFWEWNIPGLWLIESYVTGDFNPGYHNLHDSVRYINTGYFGRVAQLAVGALATVSGPTPIVLPVRIAGMSASVTPARSVSLVWNTLSELANYGFEVQRCGSRDGEYATLKGSFIPGNGTSTEIHRYSYIDMDPLPGRGWYRLRQYDLDGTVHTTDPISVESVNGIDPSGRAASFALMQNYPNPFNPATTIRFTVGPEGVGGGEGHRVRLAVYDLLGREVALLVDGIRPAGSYAEKFDASELASGTYLCRLVAGTDVQTRRMMLVR
jgi:hypothetical protein